MIYIPDYTIGESHFLFNSLAFKKYCEKKGMELEDLLTDVKAMLDTGKGFRTADFPDILLAGHQSWCLYNKLPFTADEATAYMWMDELGGIVGGVGNRIELFKVIIGKLLNIDPALLEAKSETTETEEKKSLNGETPELMSEGSPGGSSTS
jgi:hypothetical protein